MTEERLAKIEKQFLNTIVIDGIGKTLALDLIEALREERAKVVELVEGMHEASSINEGLSKQVDALQEHNKHLLELVESMDGYSE